MSSTIQVTVDDDLRKESDALFKGLGTDTTSAIRMFLKQAVMNHGFPFEIRMPEKDPYMPLSEEQIYAKLAKSRKSAEKGNVRDADDVIADLKTKYGF